MIQISEDEYRQLLLLASANQDIIQQEREKVAKWIIANKGIWGLNAAEAIRNGDHSD